MELIADILMLAGTLAAGLYCFVLSKRLSALKNAEGGIGQAVGILSNQVEDLTKTLTAAQSSARASSASLSELTVRAENVALRLELLVASMHDINEPKEPISDHIEPMFARRASRAVGE
jgi:hypothetical protein